MNTPTYMIAVVAGLALSLLGMWILDLVIDGIRKRVKLRRELAQARALFAAHIQPALDGDEESGKLCIEAATTIDRIRTNKQP